MEDLEVTDDGMNILQDNGIISDLCVSWDDVDECDRQRAIDWLNENSEMLI